MMITPGIVFVCLVYIGLLLLIYYFIKAYGYYIVAKAATLSTFYNNIKCLPNMDDCKISYDDTIPYPTTIDTTYNYTLARFCADVVSRLEYITANHLLANSLKVHPNTVLLTTLTYNIDINPLLGMILKGSDGTIFIGFRGTANMDEWIHDASYIQQPNILDIKVAPFRRPPSEVDVSPTTGEVKIPISISPKVAHQTTIAGTNINPLLGQSKVDNVLRCHTGFIEVYTRVRDTILSTVSPYKTNKIVITGHSLGAALSTLCSIDLGNQGYQVYGYVFASPRVCNGMIGDYIKQYTKVFIRISNQDDIVPTIPYPVMPNFENPDSPYMYSHTVDGSITYSDNWSSLLNNHSMPNYIHNLKPS